MITCSPLARARLTGLAYRTYSQESKISFSKAIFNAIANKICPQLVSPEPINAKAPRYIVLTKAECEAHDEQVWNQMLEKASEEYKKATENKS